MNVEQIKQKLDALKDEISAVGTPPIGIAITTRNRHEIFRKTYTEIRKFAPANSVLVIVDDASTSPCPEATFRFEQNVGIARAKNKCLELLYKAGCEHFFLFDDDCYPKRVDWYKPYVESREPHLNYIFAEFKTLGAAKLNDMMVLYRDSSIVAYSHVRGCMCYYKRICLDRVGGMDPVFGLWGYEHPSLSDRIYNAGLTSFRYMDVPDSYDLIYSRDEHTSNEGSTVVGAERRKWIERNARLYDERKDSREYIPFTEKRSIVLTCLFSNINDPQRDAPMPADKGILKALIDSMKGQEIVVISDSLGPSREGNVEYVKVETSVRNVYFQRWVSYYRYLLERRSDIGKVFITDGSDVVMLRNPFEKMKDGILYVGDEPQITGCEWMVKHHPNRELQEFMKDNTDVLLNAGLCGGSVDVVIEFIGRFLLFYFNSVAESKFYDDRPGCGDGDMGLFNYIVRKHFEGRVLHGTQVNTVFKDEKANNVAWFKHK